MHVEKEQEIAARSAREAFWDDAGRSLIVCDELGISCFGSKQKVQWELPLESPVLSAAFAGQEGLLVCMTHESGLFAVTNSGEREWSVKDSDGASVAVRNRGQLIVSASRVGVLHFYNRRGREIRSVPLDHVVDYVCFTQDGTGSVLVANSVGVLRCFHPQRGEVWEYELGPYLSGLITGGRMRRILCPAFSDGIYAFDHDGVSIGLYDFRGVVRDAAMGRFSSTILINIDNQRLLLVDEEGHPVWCYEGIPELGRVFMSPDGSRIGCTDDAGTLHLFQCEPSRRSGTPFFEIAEDSSSTSHKQALWSAALPETLGETKQLAIQNDGRIVGALGLNGRLCLFNAKGEHRIVSDSMLGAIEQVRVSHLGNMWVVRGSKGVSILDIEEGIARFTLNGQLRIRLSENGLLLVAFDGHSVYLGDKTGRFEKSKTFGDEILDIRLAGGEKAFYCLFMNGRLARYSTKGRLLWQREVQSGRPAKLAWANQRILISTESGELLCMSREGAELWKKRFPGRITRLESRGTWTEVYEGPTAVSLIDRDGRQIDSRRPVLGHVTDFADRVHALTWRDNALLCESLEGETLWRFVPKGKLSLLAVARNGFYLTCLDSNRIHYLCLYEDLPVAQSVRFLEL